MASFAASREAKSRLARGINTLELFKLDKRTVIVTGGIGSLGRDIISAIIECGGDIICIDYVNSPPQDDWKALQIVAETHDAKLWYFSCDITNVDTTRTVFEKAASEARYPLYGLVTCAGIATKGPSLEFSMDEARRIIDVNLTGTFICAQATARIMIKNELSGSMVFIASMSGYVVNKTLGSTAYNASKAGIHQLTRSLAAEWGGIKDCPMIRVNSVSPGYIRTSMTKDMLEQDNNEAVLAGGNMLNRISDPDEYRGPVVFLLSDAASFVTGADLLVDGGHTAW